jgi:type I restriction enzyme R subunit
LIQQAIDDFRAKRISDQEYLQRVSGYSENVASRRHDDVPEALQGDEHAMAFYGILKPFFNTGSNADELAAAAALAVAGIFKKNMKVNFWDDFDAQKRTMNDIDDYLYDQIKGKQGMALSTEQMDEIIERAMQLAGYRMRT